jgi:hypothetical protein
MRALLVLAAVGLVAVGCGGSRMARPIAVAAPADAQLTCDQINGEISNNEFQIVALQNEMNEAANVRSRNAMLGGMIGYSTSETGEAARRESMAYAARNVQLRSLAREKHCTY